MVAAPIASNRTESCLLEFRWLYRSDLYQGANGAIRQPFPDIPMCLSMVWYMTDVDENSGGTYCVPGSHRDTRNPRGPTDGITVTAPIPGDMQITAPAGSVYIQDSRCDLPTLTHGANAVPMIMVSSCGAVNVIARATPGCGTAQPATTFQASCALPARIVGFRGGSMRFVRLTHRHRVYRIVRRCLAQHFGKCRCKAHSTR